MYHFRRSAAALSHVVRRRLEKMRMQMEREAKEAEEQERRRKEAVCVFLSDFLTFHATRMTLILQLLEAEEMRKNELQRRVEDLHKRYCCTRLACRLLLAA